MERFWKYKLEHVFFWTATVLFHMYTRWPMIDHHGVSQFLLEILVRNGLLALLIYFNIRILMPRHLRLGWLLYGMLLAVAVSAYAVLKDLHDLSLDRLAGSGSPGLMNHTFYNISIAVFYLSFSVALVLSREWWQQRELLRRIAFDQVNTELAYLRAQINPHFLFNSINTIYFQINKDNRSAREMLSAFSDMLRYQLYECNGSTVAIEKEVAYLRSYVDLQRMRKDSHYSILFNASFDVKGFQIAPLLLIPFVENAFKHVSHAADGNRIEVGLSFVRPVFSLSVFNTCEGTASGGEGIGLRNVRRRLELLYAGNHTLTIDAQPTSFKIRLDLVVGGSALTDRPAIGQRMVFDSSTNQPAGMAGQRIVQ